MGSNLEEQKIGSSSSKGQGGTMASNVLARVIMCWLVLFGMVGATKAATTTTSTSTSTSTLTFFNEFHLERRVEMTGTGCSDVEWTVDRNANEWTVAVRGAPGLDWVGIGISENGGMKGADIMMVKRRKESDHAQDENDEEFEVLDLFSTDYERPKKDILQNVELLEAYTDDEGSIRALLRRRLDTCDAEDIKVSSYKQRLICASGAIDAQGTILFHGPMHSKASVNLFVDEALDRQSYSPQDTTRMEIAPGLSAPSNIYTSSQVVPIDVQMQDVSLDASTKTAYRCQVIQTSSDVNVVAVEAVWGDGKSIEDEPQPGHIHHQLLYRCDNVELMDPSTLDGKPYDCLDNMP